MARPVRFYDAIRNMCSVIHLLMYLFLFVNAVLPATLITSQRAKLGNYNLVWNFVFPENITSFFPDLIQQNPNDNFDIRQVNADGPVNEEDSGKLNKFTLGTSTPLPSSAMLCEKPKRKAAEIYWKVFKGPPVPDEAFLVGYSSRGTSVHIGQVYVPFKDGGLQPVAIYNNSASVTSTFVKSRSTNKNIKILCTNVLSEEIGDFLTWIPSDFAWKLNPETDLVITGVERDYYTYSGKAMYANDLRVGKAARHNKGFSMFFSYNGREIWLAKDFYVLAYKDAVKNF